VFVVDRGRWRGLNGVIGWTWNWRHVWTSCWYIDTRLRHSLYGRDNWRRNRSRDRKRNLYPTAFTFSLGFGLIVSIRAGKMVSI
jgi:hypothetical protein